MNVLITAGGTREDIDSVRSVSNHATGRLGSLIADSFAKEGAEITYICGESAILPSCGNIEIIRVRNVNGLIETIETLLHKSLFDCVIHSMAVSDYTPQTVLSIDEITKSIIDTLQEPEIPQNQLYDRIRTAIMECGKPLSNKKISSKVPDIALLLKQTPKVIGRIKSIQPDTLLVGFKLLSGVSEKELLQAGQNLLTQNSCDFVLANDLENIERDLHKAILIDKNGVLQRANTKREIAEIIYKCVSERIGA